MWESLVIEKSISPLLNNQTRAAATHSIQKILLFLVSHFDMSTVLIAEGYWLTDETYTQMRTGAVCAARERRQRNVLSSHLTCPTGCLFSCVRLCRSTSQYPSCTCMPRRSAGCSASKECRRRKAFQKLMIEAKTAVYVFD